MAIGGPRVSADGSNPIRDEVSLIQTAIRFIKHVIISEFPSLVRGSEHQFRLLLEEKYPVQTTHKKAVLDRLVKDNVALIVVLDAKFTNRAAGNPGKQQLLYVVEEDGLVIKIQHGETFEDHIRFFGL